METNGKTLKSEQNTNIEANLVYKVSFSISQQQRHPVTILRMAGAYGDMFFNSLHFKTNSEHKKKRKKEKKNRKKIPEISPTQRMKNSSTNTRYQFSIEQKRNVKFVHQ